ncbi:MAG: hypothetical protein Q4G33_14750 [bacterium]|nr:hypothetical protein [bacterium]
MRNFKLRTGLGKIYEIEKTTFEQLTNKSAPYYRDGFGHYAVCPRCDNPIQILGLYTKPKLYGRHYTRSVKGLANYYQTNYEYCPLADHKIHLTKESVSEELTEIGRNIVSGK